MENHIKNNFAAFILSHARADRVYTYNTLRRSGYTGPIYILIDNEDPQQEEYRRRYGEQVIVFDKAAQRTRTDTGDNFKPMNMPLYARNENFEVAERLGIEYFIQLDDDYRQFYYYKNDLGEWISTKRIKSLDAVLNAFLEYYKATPWHSIAFGQGGDYLGGAEAGSVYKPKRKVMNSFICSTKRPFQFVARINDDVSTYAVWGGMGYLFLTIFYISLTQTQTQSNAGGLTELYLAMGTYVKSFYSVMYSPSSVKVAMMNSKNPRIHHRLQWRYAVPCILNRKHKR
jgi:hypothetical protein